MISNGKQCSIIMEVGKGVVREILNLTLTRLFWLVLIFANMRPRQVFHFPWANKAKYTWHELCRELPCHEPSNKHLYRRTHELFFDSCFGFVWFFSHYLILNHNCCQSFIKFNFSFFSLIKIVLNYLMFM